VLSRRLALPTLEKFFVVSQGLEATIQLIKSGVPELFHMPQDRILRQLRSVAEEIEEVIGESCQMENVPMSSKLSELQANYFSQILKNCASGIAVSAAVEQVSCTCLQNDVWLTEELENMTEISNRLNTQGNKRDAETQASIMLDDLCIGQRQQLNELYQRLSECGLASEEDFDSSATSFTEEIWDHYLDWEMERGPNDDDLEEIKKAPEPYWVLEYPETVPFFIDRPITTNETVPLQQASPGLGGEVFIGPVTWDESEVKRWAVSEMPVSYSDYLDWCREVEWQNRHLWWAHMHLCVLGHPGCDKCVLTCDLPDVDDKHGFLELLNFDGLIEGVTLTPETIKARCKGFGVNASIVDRYDIEPSKLFRDQSWVKINDEWTLCKDRFIQPHYGGPSLRVMQRLQVDIGYDDGDHRIFKTLHKAVKDHRFDFGYVDYELYWHLYYFKLMRAHTTDLMGDLTREGKRYLAGFKTSHIDVRTMALVSENTVLSLMIPDELTVKKFKKLGSSKNARLVADYNNFVAQGSVRKRNIFSRFRGRMRSCVERTNLFSANFSLFPKT